MLNLVNFIELVNSTYPNLSGEDKERVAKWAFNEYNEHFQYEIKTLINVAIWQMKILSREEIVEFNPPLPEEENDTLD